MTHQQFTLQHLSAGAGSISVDLPADVVAMLKVEARAQRKPVVAYLREFLQDQAQAREAARRLADLQAGKTRAVPADEVYRRLGI